MKTRKLILIGAGPGDPSLITVRGLEALKKADVVLYDALVHPDLLQYARKSAIKICVGKRSGAHSMEQEEINQLIVEAAFGFGTVVRLKGGDPFILGRGYEEIEYARKFGIDIEVIPGVSSSTGLTALHQIPLTVRGMNDGFCVINASSEEQTFFQQLTTALQAGFTVVVLMGFKKLTAIVDALQQENMHDLPVAVIHNGSLEHEKIALGTASSIIREVKKQKLDTPAIIILGDVVKLHPIYQKKLGIKKVVLKEKQIAAEAARWIDKKQWTIRSGLPEPPGILPIEHLAKLRFRRAIRSYLKKISENQKRNNQQSNNT